MKRADLISERILSLSDLLRKAKQWRAFGKSIGFTNGVFDILHKGHIASLSAAASEADLLVVGLNSDASVKRLKGSERPVNDQGARALILASLLMVDAVVVFEEDTPLELIKSLLPDVLIKGGDYELGQIVGAKEVIENGGRVVINPIIEGYSTSSILKKLGNQ